MQLWSDITMMQGLQKGSDNLCMAVTVMFGSQSIHHWASLLKITTTRPSQWLPVSCETDTHVVPTQEGRKAILEVGRGAIGDVQPMHSCM